MNGNENPRRHSGGEHPAAPRGVLFDLGGTLLRELKFDRWAGRSHLLEIANNPKKITLADYSAVADEFQTTVYANREDALVEFSVAAFGRLVYERLGLTFDIPPEDVELEFWNTAARMEPEPGVGEMLEALCAEGIALGVVSNSSFSGYTLSKEIEKHEFPQHFQFVISSADYSIRKPHRALFLMAAAKLGLEPEETWFAGDTLRQDIVGAIDAGMTAIWYNPGGDPAGAYEPDIEIRHWKELTETLELNTKIQQ